MRSFIKKLAGAMALSMVVSLAAPAGTATLAATNLKVAYQNGSAISEINLANIGDTEDLKFLGAPSNWKELGATWTSSNESVATVDKNGVVTAVAAGSAAITIKVGEDEASVAVNVVNLPTYTATMGTSDNRNITSMELKPEETFDFNFYGIWDYDKNRYICDWLSADDEVATVDNKGLVTAVAPGKTKITLSVKNLITGIRHTVDYCVINVEKDEVVATPTPTEIPVEASIEAKQTTEDTIVVTLEGLKASDYADKDRWEIYAVEEDAYEYIWQIYTATVNEEENTVTLVGYNELEDEQYYDIRIVTKDDKDGNNEVEHQDEDGMVASVGPVEEIELEYGSYRNNQGYIAFPNRAYTNGNDGEEIQTYLSYKLFDSNGINVTGHYNNAANGYNIVSYEIIDPEDKVAPYINIWEENGITIMTFDDILNTAVRVRAVYEDYDEKLQRVNTKETIESMLVTEAPDYFIEKINDWQIYNETTGKTKTEIALFDDMDQTQGKELSNHHIVLWFTDNYGNKYITSPEVLGDKKYSEISTDTGKYYNIEESNKFTNEGYEIHFETRNPQVLVVGDTEEDTNSSTITTKRVGTARVNVTLHNVIRNDYNSTLVKHIEAISIPVKAERYLSRIDVDNINLTTDSIPVGASEGVKILSTEKYGYYDTRWTTKDVEVYLYDQYGDIWGSVNPTRRDNGNTEVVFTTTADLDETEIIATYHPDQYYYKDFDGAKLLEQLSTNNENKTAVSYVKYTVTVTDNLKNTKKTTSFNISLKQPTHDENPEHTQPEFEYNYNDIITSKALKVKVDNVNFTGIQTKIEVIEYSRNGLAVNYADGITLIDSQAEYDKVFNTETATATTGALYLVVYNPDNKIVGTSTGSSQYLGEVIEKESGLYDVIIADTNNNTAATEFAKAGTYKVKVLQVTGTTKTGKVAFKTAYNDTFTVTDDLLKVDLKNQEKIYLENIDDIEQVVYEAFTFNNPDWDRIKYGYDNGDIYGISGVRYRLNTRANSVIVQNVFFKAYIDKDNKIGYYYVEADVNKTVKLDNINVISADDSIPQGKTPADFGY